VRAADLNRKWFYEGKEKKWKNPVSREEAAKFFGCLVKSEKLKSGKGVDGGTIERPHERTS
jgi:hypothetical protein